MILVAAAEPGSVFVGWSARCAGAGPRLVAPSGAPLRVTATFAPLRRLTIAATGDASGEVTVDDAVCELRCLRDVVEGTTVHLRAYTPSRFGGWSGAWAGPGPGCALLVWTDVTATAHFGRDDGEAWSSTVAFTPELAAFAGGDVVIDGYDPSAAPVDAVIARVGPADQVRWTRRFAGPLGAHVTGVAATGDAVFVLIEKRADEPRAGTVQLTKLGATGVEDWSRPFGGEAFSPQDRLQVNELVVAPARHRGWGRRPGGGGRRVVAVQRERGPRERLRARVRTVSVRR